MPAAQRRGPPAPDDGGSPPDASRPEPRGDTATPEPIPDFDLYEELEVSPKASSRTIEAAYRALLKIHHPDVAGASPEVIEKAKRLNIARDWLTDKDRRAVYDQARAAAASTARPGAAPAAAGAASAPPPPQQPSTPPGGPGAGAGAGTGAGVPPYPGAGVPPYPGAGAGASRPRSSTAVRDAAPKANAEALDVFLADIATLDAERARRIAARAADAGVAVRTSGAYETATASVASAGMNQRTGAWTHARAAARRAVNAQVGANPAGRPVSRVAADLAGAIVVRDLVLPREYATIRDVWTGDNSAATAARTARPASGGGSTGGAASGRPGWLQGTSTTVVIFAIVAIVGAAVLLLLFLQGG